MHEAFFDAEGGDLGAHLRHVHVRARPFAGCFDRMPTLFILHIVPETHFLKPKVS
jgi:hypothetical protein